MTTGRRRLRCAPSNRRPRLVSEDWADLKAIQSQQAYQEIPRVMSVWRERTIREDLHLLLERKFGSLSAEVKAKIDSMSGEKARELMLAILEAKSLAELGLE